MQKSLPRPRRRRSKGMGTGALPEGAQPNPSEGLCGVAMLKIAMELKKHASVPIGEIVDGVLSTMAIDAAAFRKYVATRGGVLQRLERMRRGQRP